MTWLPFRLPDFTRLIWHSADARTTWAPRLSRINTAWAAMERLAVVEGYRQACLTFFEPGALPVAAQQAIDQGLLLIPLQMSGLTDQYSATPQAPVAGKPFQYRAVLLRPESAKAWVAAWNNGQVKDHDIGELLGYPMCCRNFFQRVWVEAQGVDTSWQMANNTPHAHRREWDRGEERRVDESPAEANILWRWMGVRLVPHLPCSFQCAATVTQAREFADTGRKYGYAQEVDWMLEILSWPVEWSSLHGVAEVRTPILTVSTRTDASAGARVVQRHGTAYPEEGAQGLRFPFRQPSEPRVTAKPAYQRGGEAVGTPTTPVWARNGFGSPEAMDAAHAVVLGAIPRRHQGGTMLDLGCGSGRLLKRAEALGYAGRGIELEPARAAGAESRVVVGSLFDTTLWAESYDLIAVMPGRLLEPGVTSEMAAEVMRALQERARQVLLYAYGDWIADKSLLELSRRAGFVIDDDVVAQVGPSAQALVLTM